MEMELGQLIGISVNGHLMTLNVVSELKLKSMDGSCGT
jgi:hypothetical protein